MEDYINYTVSLFRAGYSNDVIYADLLNKGFEPRLVTWLIEAAGQRTGQGSQALQGQAPSAQSYPNAPRNALSHPPLRASKIRVIPV
jgi:hypothetical protein